jgi:hypothetical protein
MHAYGLADLAALAAVHGRQLIAADPETIDRSLTAYWRASRCRLDRWCRGLSVMGKHRDSRPWTADEVGVVEEILVSEILSRVVAAIAVAHDAGHAVMESAPIGRNIFDGHLDARRRALSLITARRAHQTESVDAILALHRQCDRWNDLLLAYLLPYAVVDEFAASPARVRDFAYDVREHLRSGAASDAAVTMIIAGLRSSFLPLSENSSPNSDLNLEIATAVLAGFSPEVYDSLGHLRSGWLERIRTMSSESPLVGDNSWQFRPHGPHQLPRSVHWRR